MSKLATTTSIFAIAICCTQSSAQEVQSSHAIPDFRVYGRRGFLSLETPPSGPGPIGRLKKRADGTMDPLSGGDYTSPLIAAGRCRTGQRSAVR